MLTVTNWEDYKCDNCQKGYEKKELKTVSFKKNMTYSLCIDCLANILKYTIDGYKSNQKIDKKLIKLLKNHKTMFNRKLKKSTENKLFKRRKQK